MDQDEASLLMIAALRATFMEAERIQFEHVPDRTGGEINPEDYTRFRVGELVLAANYINNMIDPLPAYTAWQLREIESIPSGGPYLWGNKDENAILIGLVPYGVRKVEFVS